jgi:oligoendopeptidase F
VAGPTQPFRMRGSVLSFRGMTPTRDQVNPEDTWDLTPLYADGAAWERDFSTLQRQYPSLALFEGKLCGSAAVLRDALEASRQMNLLIERLAQYASLRTSEDSSNSESLTREGQLENLMTRIGEVTAYMDPEIQAIDDQVFESFLAKPELRDWQIPLRKLRRLKPHTLSTPEERLLALGYTALRGHAETFSQLTNVDMDFGRVIDENGVERTLTQSSYGSFLVRRNAELRKNVFHQFYKEFGAHQYTLASTLASSVRADVFSARARHYPSARAAALYRDDVPLSVYDNLISTVRSKLAPLLRYYALRKRVLKLDEIHAYDTGVPIVPKIETHVSFDDATKKVIAALEPLGSEYCAVLSDGLGAGRWCDRYENKGKRSGAFSSGGYQGPPYILMNYKEDVFADIYTLAHEAGHSMHTWYARRSQPFQTYDYPIFLAEVASTFNEELLTHYLLERTNDRAMRAYLINRQIDDIRGTVYRQTMFAEFEKLTHEAEERGDALTLDAFRQIYRGLLKDYFGDDFVLDAELDLECLRIPHFYNAFYVYKYATGLSAAVSLARQTLEEGQIAVERYLGFLKSGGSEFPLPTLRKAGVDMEQPAPIEQTLALFERRVGELENLLG